MLSFQRKQLSKVQVVFPDVTREKLATAVESFATVEAFTPDPSNKHVATAALRVARPCVLEEDALHFGGLTGSLVVLSAETLEPGVPESTEPQ